MGLGLVSRIKILAGMNIVERRRPQDGQLSTDIDGTDIDVLADANISGVVAQFGQGALKEIAGRMLKIFAGNVAQAVNTPA